jgi:hypothetical protein
VMVVNGGPVLRWLEPKFAIFSEFSVSRIDHCWRECESSRSEDGHMQSLSRVGWYCWPS